MTTYSIDDKNGNHITTGIRSLALARPISQRQAAKRGESVYLYEDGSGSKPEQIQPVDTLYDSETNESLTAEQLGVTDEQYRDAVLDSAGCTQFEGHVLVNGRRVYAL